MRRYAHGDLAWVACPVKSAALATGTTASSANLAAAHARNAAPTSNFEGRGGVDVRDRLREHCYWFVLQTLLAVKSGLDTYPLVLTCLAGSHPREPDVSPRTPRSSHVKFAPTGRPYSRGRGRLHGVTEKLLHRLPRAASLGEREVQFAVA